MSFGNESTTDEVLEGVDLSGRWVLVTGASAGLGQETARAVSCPNPADAPVTKTQRPERSTPSSTSSVVDSFPKLIRPSSRTPVGQWFYSAPHGHTPNRDPRR